jgi:hypothetical protein
MIIVIMNLLINRFSIIIILLITFKIALPQLYMAANPRSRVRFLALPDCLSSNGSGNGVHAALVGVNEELLERKVAAPV